MKILAVDTSAMIATVAVMEDEMLLAEYSINHQKNHSIKLMPLIEQMLFDLNLSSYDMDIFAASVGPGSFTGLRIGITTIKAMAYVCQKPVAAVKTLEALAANVVFAKGIVCPMMDAKNNQVFTALYGTETGRPQIIGEEMGIPVNELCAILKAKQQPVFLLGDAALMHREIFVQALGKEVNVVPGHLLLQKASSVGRIAYLMQQENKITDGFTLQPFYLRKSQAERLREQAK